MKDVVPGTLQRLRAADIIRMAGLNAASLGQEYARAGTIHEARRQGAKLSGIVEIPHASATLRLEHDAESDSAEPRRFAVEIEVQSTSSWTRQCSCKTGGTLLCAHAAALLYRWLTQPGEFDAIEAVSPTGSLSQDKMMGHSQPSENIVEDEALPDTAKSTTPVVPAKPVNIYGGSTWDLLDILTQLGLSELRSIAREYNMTVNGLQKQRIAEMLVEELHKPEAIRRIATTLEKPPRQLLAAVTLAGGLVSDDDLRGLFERFSLGQSGQLQRVLVTLQSKALLFRTNMNGASSQRSGLSSALLDIGWYVPLEVRSALRVTVPTTVFQSEQAVSEQEGKPRIELAESYGLLANLLLVARTLDGFELKDEEDGYEHVNTVRSGEMATLSRVGSGLSGDGSVSIPPPPDTPASALLSLVREHISLSPDLLRFAIRLLRLADILHKDDSGTPHLRALPNVAQLFLGTNRAEAARDLFELWLTQSSYAELFDLQEEGLRLRCRATALNFPALRSGELDAENRDARQALIGLLTQIPAHQWVNFTAYARLVYRLNPLFLQRKQRQFSAPHWWIEQEIGHPLRPHQLNDWSRAEIHYLARLLQGPLHWWGACDIASTQDGRLVAFRLTEVADWLFNGIANGSVPFTPEMPAITDTLEILDEDILRVRCTAQSWPIIELMEHFAESAGVDDGYLRYRLTPNTLSNALRHGHRPSELLDVLRELAAHTHNAVGAATTLLERLERWLGSYGKVRIYTGVTLLETVDTVVMRELAMTTNVNEQIVQTINPTLHILKKSGAEQIIDELKRRGQSPLLHDEDRYGAE